MSPEKELQVCEDFKAGKTTTELATLHGVSYQAIHRILKKHGLSRKSGGKSAQVAARNAAETAASSAIQERHGCSTEQWDALRAMDEDYKKTPLAAYNTFKNNFQNVHPDVGFDLTLWNWWLMWEASGRWTQRMRNPEGMWVMAQVDKSLPLTKENARIIPFGQLLKETRTVTKGKSNGQPVIIPTTLTVQDEECLTV